MSRYVIVVELPGGHRAVLAPDADDRRRAFYLGIRAAQNQAARVQAATGLVCTAVVDY